MLMEKQKAQIVCKLGRVLSYVYSFFLHCVLEELLSFKMRSPSHVQGLEKWLAILSGSFSVLFAYFLRAGIGLVQKLYTVSATAGPGKQFDLVR